MRRSVGTGSFNNRRQIHAARAASWRRTRNSWRHSSAKPMVFPTRSQNSTSKIIGEQFYQPARRNSTSGTGFLRETVAARRFVPLCLAVSVERSRRALRSRPTKYTIQICVVRDGARSIKPLDAGVDCMGPAKGKTYKQKSSSACSLPQMHTGRFSVAIATLKG